MSILNSLFGSNDKRPSYEIYTYRTKDGAGYFKFSYHFLGSGYEIDIHQTPDYGSRSKGYIAHLLSSPRDASHRICIISEARPKTLENAKNFSMMFAELTWEYIKTGITIDTQIAMQSKNRESDTNENQE